MTKINEIELIKEEMATVEKIFLGVVDEIPSFDITDTKILPYGLRAHTRSISWIVEQVITQQAKYHAKRLGIDDVDINLPDTCLHDCVIYKNSKRYFVNVKIHNADGRDNKNDISAVEKLYMQYRENKDYRLIYACFGIRFSNLTISFVRENVHVFSPQFLPIYVNPRNDKIQAFYHHEPEQRSRTQFLQQLREKSRSIILE
ncbi:MAG: hypothetical protein KJ757_02180 [Planctomycetes bacterium]|nr:hypothetical protein [Planctomycetota bacterium]MBU1518242.1 hypothetical protein [Planctomycetota bacterium]MBU2457091.1 hypothetical protein [Planctomycetota bacterium]MBU2596358.1 hypothetical protein [Planctomycetota bacterium]